MKWKDKLLKEFINQLSNSNSDKNWEMIISGITKNDGIGVHLAVFNEPYISAMFSNKKTIESRFSINRINPFRRVYEQDLVLIKKTPGNVIGFFICGNIKHWVKNKGIRFQELESKYGKAICTHFDPNFWENRKDAMYGTLIEIDQIHALEGFDIGKKDRTTWVVLKDRSKPLIFENMMNINE